MKKVKLTLLGMMSIALFNSCDEDVNNVSNNELNSKKLTLNFKGLEDLGPNYKYEGWIMVNGKPVTTGVFSINSNGVQSQTEFQISSSNLYSATKFILTIEPFPDTDPNPTDVHILAGDFVSNSAILKIDAQEALGNDFSTAKGKYVLATPSDNDSTNEKSGIWFIGSLPPSQGLDLPNLPKGWKYEGWVVIDGKPLSTGTFTSATTADSFSGFSGALATPPFPGEDFLKNAPTGLSFPTNLQNKTAVISIEPFPDNSPAPFLLKPLLATISTTAKEHVVYMMNNNATATNPTGTAKK